MKLFVVAVRNLGVRFVRWVWKVVAYENQYAIDFLLVSILCLITVAIDWLITRSTTIATPFGIIGCLVFFGLYILPNWGTQSPAWRKEIDRIVMTYTITDDQARRVLILMRTPPIKWPDRLTKVLETSIARTLVIGGKNPMESLFAEFVREEDYQREVVDGLPQV